MSFLSKSEDSHINCATQKSLLDTLGAMQMLADRIQSLEQRIIRLEKSRCSDGRMSN
jgi:hypothetical protein